SWWILRMIEWSGQPRKRRIQRTRVPEARLRAWSGLVGVRQDRDVVEVSVPLCEIQPVADHEAIRDLESDVADRQVHPAPLGLGEQRTDLERGGVPRLQASPEVLERQPGVDDVLDDQDVPPLDRRV